MAGGVGVVLTGATLSILTGSLRQPEALPATSTARVSKMWVPLPETVAWVGAGPPRVTGPPSTRHSSYRRPETESAPLSMTV